MDWILFERPPQESDEPCRGAAPLLPLLTVALYSDERDDLIEDVTVLVDTGSSQTVLPTSLVVDGFGIKVGSTEIPAVTGAGKAGYRRISDPILHCLWNGHDVLIAPYASDSAELPMPGLHDFLRHFVATFDAARVRFSLTPAQEGCCAQPG